MTHPVLVGDDADGYIHPLAKVGSAPEHRDWPRDRDGLAPIVDRSARLEAFVTVDAGIDQPTRVGARSWMLKHSHLGHDATIGDDCVVTTGAIIGGYCEIADRVKIGLGAIILPYRKVGAGATVGAGAVVTKDVPAGVTVVGNPACAIADERRDPLPHNQRTDRTVKAA